MLARGAEGLLRREWGLPAIGGSGVGAGRVPAAAMVPPRAPAGDDVETAARSDATTPRGASIGCGCDSIIPAA